MHRGGFYAKGSSHVDLIVVLNGIPTSNHERWLYVLLAALRTTVERNFPGMTCLVSHVVFCPDI